MCIETKGDITNKKGIILGTGIIIIAVIIFGLYKI